MFLSETGRRILETALPLGCLSRDLIARATRPALHSPPPISPAPSGTIPECPSGSLHGQRHIRPRSRLYKSHGMDIFILFSQGIPAARANAAGSGKDLNNRGALGFRHGNG